MNHSAIEMNIVPRTSDIGNLEVRRALPFKDRRMVGPFIFWDQMGPGEFLQGQGMDVRPHPHIGLSTVSYLFEGSMDHKDSLGTDIRIHPGDVNLMTAGGGIVHSERTGRDVRQQPSRLFGIQSWLALPTASEEGDPAFQHVGKAELPKFSDKGLNGRVVLGEYQGLHSPVHQTWETLYLDLQLDEGERWTVPTDVEERALYAVSGSLSIEGQHFPAEQMVVLKPGAVVTLNAETPLRLMLLGGAVMDGPRYIWWNLVGSRKETLEAAAKRWKDGNFPAVPGDTKEFIPLPEMPRLADYP